MKICPRRIATRLRSCSTKHWIATALICALAVAGLIYGFQSSRPQEGATPKIRRAEYYIPDTIKVITLSGATTFFRYKGEDMGYQYELLRLYTESRGRAFTIEVASSLEEIHQAIESGRAHLSITPEAVTNTGRKHFVYTGPEEQNGLVLVQPKPHRPKDKDSLYIKDVTQLLGRDVYVLSGSRDELRLKHLQEQLGGTINISRIEGDTVNVEDLIGMVSAKQINYALADQELAKIAATYYPNVDISLEVGFPQRLRWITNPREEGLALDLDRWSVGIEGMDSYKNIYKRYFEDLKTIDQSPAVQPIDIGPLPKGKISPFDELFKQASSRLPWSWEILASIAYQESRFRADVVGWSGARGLMGIMPSTGRIFGASKEDLLSPSVSIRVSVDCLLATESLFKSIGDAEQRLKFTLAGYNAGVGHVQDAQRLAEKYGADPHVWDDNVEKYILLKRESKYYQDPVCKHGYLRGQETYTYTREVFGRYQAYRASRQ